MNEIREILFTLSDDDKKIEEIRKLDNDLGKATIIRTLSDNNKKIQELRKLNDDLAKAGIIMTLRDDGEKIQELKRLSDDNAKAIVIEILHNDDKKIELLRDLKDYTAKAIIIESLHDDDKKIQELRKIKDDSVKAAIIETLRDDDKKIQELREIENEILKAEIIETLRDDDKKIQELRKIKDEPLKAEIISTIQNIDKKMQELENLSDDFLKTEIIKKLYDDEDKIRGLGILKEELAKAIIIRSLHDDDKKQEELSKLTNDFAKALIIEKLKDNNKKLEKLTKLTDDFAKAIIIRSLYDDDKKQEELSKLTDSFAKAIVIADSQSNSESILLKDREKNKSVFLENNRKYSKIGLSPNMTIGIEIESEGILSDVIQSLKTINEKQISGEKKVWNSKGEGSLVLGVEVVSPILTDNKENVEDIYIVCSMLKKFLQKSTERCGGHIHIGADYLKSKEAYINLFEIWGNTEEIIYIMSNEKGSIPRIRLPKYACSISSELNEAIEEGIINLESEEDLETFINKIKKIQKIKNVGLNIINEHNTIEFRTPNGTINPDTWIENIRLFGRIVEISQKLADIEKNSEHSKEDEELLYLKNKLKMEISEQEKMEILLELLFSEEERNVYRERYISNSELLKQIPDKENPLKKVKFRKVNFNQRRHNLSEFYNVAIHERIENTNQVLKETIRGAIKENEMQGEHNII